MLLMVEKVISGEICHSIYGYAKDNNKYMKYYDDNKESSHTQYWNVNNLYGCSMSQNVQSIILSGSQILLDLINIS